MIRYCFSCVLCCCLVLCGGLVQADSFALLSEPKVVMYKVGEATVWSIADSNADREMGVFPDAPSDILKKYASRGQVPSGIMVFVIQLNDQFILIDTGMGELGREENTSMLMSGLERLNLSPEKVNLVLLTHMHFDHIGGLMRDGKKVFPNAKILVNRLEHGFWLRDQSVLEFPQSKAGFALAKQIMALYGEAVELFDYADVVAPGIKVLDVRGHTPGHSAFLLESGGEKLLFWGDLLHAAELQFPNPEINATYDMNPPVAALTRIRFMEMAALENLAIAGAHLPFPAIGYVKKTGTASYSYSPIL